jgi:signal transduction histidine kinase
MKTLQTFARYLKNEKLEHFSEDSVRQMRALKVPMLKYFSDLSDTEMSIRSLPSQEKFLSLLEDETALLKAADSLRIWEEDKLPGLSGHDIHPSDLVLLYAAQKKAMLKYLTEYTQDAREIITIISELEDYYTQVQDGAVQMLFKIQRETEKKLRESEAMLKAKTIDLERSNQELEQFAYVASHDLQEPLRMVNSYVQLLSNRYQDKLDAEANEFIHFAVDGSNRMRNLINSLLEFSRVNRIKPFAWMDASAVLEEVLLDLSPRIMENKAIVHCDGLPEIYGDQVLIGQLFQNLIANAIKFKGDAAPEVTISYEKRNNDYLFAVKDNGIGIKKEYAEKIFVIFRRLHGIERYPGTGIGLAICKKIVERHGGRIWVESEPEKGATFYFTVGRFK